MPSVSLVATLVATVAGFILGAIWYGPLLGKAWMAENRFTEEELKKNFNPARTYGTTFVLSFIGAYVFGMFLGPDPDPSFATLVGFLAGLCWVAFSLATSYLFEGRTGRLWLINGGYFVVQFTLFGAAFGLLG